jgi:hypothetical protein
MVARADFGGPREPMARGGVLRVAVRPPPLAHCRRGHKMFFMMTVVMDAVFVYSFFGRFGGPGLSTIARSLLRLLVLPNLACGMNCQKVCCVIRGQDLVWLSDRLQICNYWTDDYPPFIPQYIILPPTNDTCLPT